MSSKCAACAVPIANLAGLGVFYLGRRFDFCSSHCRLAFKRDPAGALARNPGAGRAPEVHAPAPSGRRGPFSIRSGPPSVPTSSQPAEIDDDSRETG